MGEVHKTHVMGGARTAAVPDVCSGITVVAGTNSGSCQVVNLSVCVWLAANAVAVSLDVNADEGAIT